MQDDARRVVHINKDKVKLRDQRHKTLAKEPHKGIKLSLDASQPTAFVLTVKGKDHWLRTATRGERDALFLAARVFAKPSELQRLQTLATDSTGDDVAQAAARAATAASPQPSSPAASSVASSAAPSFARGSASGPGSASGTPASSGRRTGLFGRRK